MQIYNARWTDNTDRSTMQADTPTMSASCITVYTDGSLDTFLMHLRYHTLHTFSVELNNAPANSEAMAALNSTEKDASWANPPNTGVNNLNNNVPSLQRSVPPAWVRRASIKGGVCLHNGWCASNDRGGHGAHAGQWIITNSWCTEEEWVV